MEKKSLATMVTSGIVWTYGERFFAQLITLVVSVVLARLLSPEHYGIIAIVTVFITICDAFITGGFGNALVQKKDVDDLDFNSVCWVSIGISIVFYFALFFAAPYIAKFYNEPLLKHVIQVMGIRFIFSAYNSVQQAYVQKKMMFKKFFFATLGGTVFSAVLGIVMAYLGFGVWALVGQIMSNTVIDTIILFFTINWKLKLEFSAERITDLWGFGWKMLVSTLVFTFKDNLRSLIIGKQFTSSDLAYYNQGKKYPSLLVTDIVESLGKVLFPVLSSEQDSRVKIKNYVRKSIRLSSFILLPVIIGLISVADTFVMVILTEKWIACVPYLRILSLVYITRSLSTVFQKAILAVGKSNINLLHEVITSILTIILVIISALYLKSVIFIAWSYVMVMVVGVAIFAYFINELFGYSYWEMICDYCPVAVMSCIMGVVVFFVGKIDVSSWLKLLIQVGSGGLIYVTIAAMTKNEEFYYLMNYVKGVFRKK